MYRRAGLVALSLFGATNAQTANKCWTCTETVAITDLTNSNGKCYFTSTLDSQDATEFTDCDGSCFVKYTSEDGILTSVSRGCLAATDTATESTAKTGFDFLDGAADVSTLTGTDQHCKIDTTAGGAVLHQVGNTFTANQEANRLTDMTCSKICKADSDTVACNGGDNYEVETLTDCGGLCKDTAVCTCDHWTGEVTYTCAAAGNPILGFTQRPVLNGDRYECQDYDCGTTCTNTDSTTDPANPVTTDISGAGCVGNGQPGSSGTCRCATFGTAIANTDPALYTSGQFLDTSDAAAKVCSPVTCSDCTGTGQQCQHALFATSGTCGCTTAGDVQNSDNTACETPSTDRKCQQCSSDLETGDDCANGNVQATTCASGTTGCAAVSTLWINANGESIREVVERGCSGDTVVKDTCEFQTISTNPASDQSSEFEVATVTEVTCRYVCDTDNCNAELADGIDVAEPTARKCNVGVVCNGVDQCKDVANFAADVESAYVADSSCANINGEQAFCVANMDYLEHERFDGVYERSLTKLEYKCQVADAVTGELDVTETTQSCTTSTITVGQTNFHADAKTDILPEVRGVITMHHCTTVCDSDNCNNAWPGQPTCYTCNSGEFEADGVTLKTVADPDYCFTNVNMAEPCDNYFENACFVTQSGLDLTSNWAVKSMNPYSAMQSMGAYKAISRGCARSSEAAVVDGEVMTRDESQNQRVYSDRMVTCLDNGCNFGPALPTPEN